MHRIPLELLAELNECGNIVAKVQELKEQIKFAMDQVIVIGRREKYSEREIHDLIVGELRNRGVNDRALYWMLSKALKARRVAALEMEKGP
jgi:hypothetical protein